MEKSEIIKICDSIKSLLNDKKVENIVEFDMSENNNKMTDFCLIGSGTSSRHAQAVTDYLYDFFKKINVIPNVAGSTNSGWIMMEALGIEIHIFKPDVRNYYSLEAHMKSN